MGDSNTENLNFGSGRNTFGVWMPGNRMKAGRICDIPDPSAINTSYRHLVIHCGINDIWAHNPKPLPTIAEELKKKCISLTNAFPHTKLHTSLLLPTKNMQLNQMVNEFNRHIVSFSKQHYNISIISHNNLSDPSGRLMINYGRHFEDGTPKMHDQVHLGNKGISILCTNIKHSNVKIRP